MIHDTLIDLHALAGIVGFWRVQSAKNALTQRTAGWQSSYIDHVGFTLISLFDGFGIVAMATSFVKNRSIHQRL